MATQQLDESDWRAKDAEAIVLFSPGAPIDEDDLFAGRQPQIDQIIEAVLQRGQHAIIYGERGVGKTSLARTFSLRLVRPTKTISSVMVNCDPSDDFESLWRKVYRDLSDGNQNLGETSANPITPDEVRRTLAGFDLTTTPIIILDEFDKIVDARAKELVANTIKCLSDYSVHATLILVGVANSVSELVADHQSIARALVQVQMPRMTDKELDEIITKRLSRIGMRITPEAKAQIVVLSRGLPHYTHLLGQFATRQAIKGQSLNVTEAHVDQAQKDCLQRVDQTIREQYHSATHSPRSGNIYKEVLLACALAEPDQLGFFPAKAVEAPLTLIMAEEYKVPKFGQHLTKLCTSERGKILEVMGTPRRYRYRFVEPLMQPFVLMSGLSDGLVQKEILKKVMPNPLQPRLSNAF